jgi:hypothetical protein
MAEREEVLRQLDNSMRRGRKVVQFESVKLEKEKVPADDELLPEPKPLFDDEDSRVLNEIVKERKLKAAKAADVPDKKRNEIGSFN